MDVRTFFYIYAVNFRAAQFAIEEASKGVPRPYQIQKKHELEASIKEYKRLVKTDPVDPNEDEKLQEKIRELTEKIDHDRADHKLAMKVHRISDKRVKERLDGYIPLRTHLSGRVQEHFVKSCEIAGKEFLSLDILNSRRSNSPYFFIDKYCL